MVKFVLKAGKEVLEVHHEQGESFEDFQAKVYTLTDIPPKNLKVLFKAKLIKVVMVIHRTTRHCSQSLKVPS